MKVSGIKQYRKQQIFYGYIFISLAIVTFIIFKYVPIFNTFVLSLYNYTPGSQEFIGLENFTNIASDDIFWLALSNTTILVVLIAGFGTVLGYILALLFRGGVYGGKFFRTIFFLPVVTTITVVALVFKILYNPIGFGFSINAFVRVFGLEPIPFLNSTKTALLSITVPLIWKIAAYNMIIFIAALDGIDIQQLEAAKMEGAGFWQQLWYIIIPGTKFSISLVVILAIMRTYRVFVPVYVMTFGDPNHSTETLVTWIYKKSFRFWEMGYGSAIAVVLFIIILVLTVIQMRVTRGDNE
jgi:multiple sugar transport system permease protein